MWPEDWINFDASPRLRLERMPLIGAGVGATVGRLFPSNVQFGDIVRGLPVADMSASAVYCSHVLEHLPRNYVAVALRNTFKILAREGVFRLVVPDLHWRVMLYVSKSDNGDPFAADHLLEACLLVANVEPSNALTLIKEYYGNSAHLWM